MTGLLKQTETLFNVILIHNSIQHRLAYSSLDAVYSERGLFNGGIIRKKQKQFFCFCYYYYLESATARQKQFLGTAVCLYSVNIMKGDKAITNPV